VIEISTVSSATDVENGHVVRLGSVRDETKSVPWVNRTVEEDDLVGANITTTVVAVGVVNRDGRMTLVDAVDILAHTKEVVEVDELAEGNVRALNSLIITVLDTSLVDPGTGRSSTSFGIDVLEFVDLNVVGSICAVLTLALEPLGHKELVSVVSTAGSTDDGAHLVHIPHAAKTVVITRVLDDSSNRVGKRFKEGGLIEKIGGLGASLEVSENLVGVGLHQTLDGTVGLSKTSSTGRTDRIDDNLEVLREIQLGKDRSRAGIGDINEVGVLLTHPSRKRTTVRTTEGHNFAVRGLELLLDKIDENSVISKGLISTEKTKIAGPKSAITRGAATIETVLDGDHQSAVLLSLLVENKVVGKFNLAKRTFTTKHDKDRITVTTPEGSVNNIMLLVSGNIILAKVIVPLIEKLENVSIRSHAFTIKVHVIIIVTTSITYSCKNSQNNKKSTRELHYYK